MSQMILVLLFLTLAPPQEVGQEQIERALEMFRMHEADDQQAIVQEVERRTGSLKDEGVRSLLALRDEARRKLKIRPWPGPQFYEPAVYAPVQNERSFVPLGASDEEQQYDLMRPWENDTEYSCRIRYDYASNVAFDLGTEPTPEEKLIDYLNGDPPDTDLLVAWLESRFDHDRSLDKYADYFNHAYCDRDGNCYSRITIYDAFASQNQVEMSDVDVIAYARNVLNDRSFRSPIPPDRRRQQLYEKISEGFLLYHRSRIMSEAAANLYVNPEAWLRPEHEGLRERLKVAFALAESNVDRIEARIVKAKTRDEFVDALDDLIEKDPKVLEKGYLWAEERIRSRWAIAKEAYAVLRERGLLHS